MRGCDSLHARMLYACRPAIRTRVVGSLHGRVGMQHDCAGMPDCVGHRHIVAGGHEPVDEVAVEPRLDHQVADRLATGTADIPARAPPGLVEWLASGPLA